MKKNKFFYSALVLSFSLFISPLSINAEVSDNNIADKEIVNNEADYVNTKISIKTVGETPICDIRNGELKDISYEENGIGGAWFIVRAAEKIGTSSQGVFSKLYNEKEFISTMNENLISLNNSKNVQILSELQKLEEKKENNSDTVDYVTANKVVYGSNYIAVDGIKYNKVYQTDKNGNLNLSGLPYGTYELIEVKAPSGYVRTHNNITYAVLANSFGHKSISVEFKHDRQKMSLSGATRVETPVKEEKDVSLHISKNSDKYIYKPGELAHFYTRVTNTGTAKLENIDIIDYTEDETGKVIAEIDELEAGEYKDIDFDYQTSNVRGTFSKVSGRIYATATESIEESNVNLYVGKLEGNSYKHIQTYDDCDIIVSDSGIGVSTETDTNMYKTGDFVFITETIINANKVPVENIVVTHDFIGNKLDKLEYISDVDGVVYDNGITKLSYIPAESSVTLKYQIKVNNSKTGEYQLESKVYSNYGSATSSFLESEYPVETVLDESIVDFVVGNPKLKITMVSDRDNYKSGQKITYKVTAKNIGDIPLTRVTLKGYSMTGEFTDIFTKKDKADYDSNIAYVGRIVPDEEVTFEYTDLAKTNGTDYSNKIIGSGIVEGTEETNNIYVDSYDVESVHIGNHVGVRKLLYTDKDLLPIRSIEVALYAQDDILSPLGNTVIIPKGTLIEKVTTDKDGYARFKLDLPLGCYIAKDTSDVYGTYHNRREFVFDSTDYINFDTAATVYRGGNLIGAETVSYIKLEDDDTRNPIYGASFSVVDRDDDVKDNYIYSEEKGHVIYGLQPEKEYDITEIYTKDGYVNKYINCFVSERGKFISKDKTKATFTIKEDKIDIDDNDKISELPTPLYVVLTNKSVVGNSTINKLGNVLSDISFLEKTTNKVQSLFGFMLNDMSGIEFDVVASDDIIHPDELTGIIHKTGDVVYQLKSTYKTKAHIVTDKEGNATAKDMLLGNYSFIEKNTKDGYQISEKPIDFTLQWVDGYTEVVEATVGTSTLINERKNTRITVSCYDDETTTPIEDVTVGIYTDEDIKGKNNNVIIKKETLINTTKTNKNGIATFEGSYPVGRYYIQVIDPADGYSLNTEKYQIETINNTSDDTILKNVQIPNKKESGNLGLNITSIGGNQSGKEITYMIDTLKNPLNVDLKNFSLIIDIPDEVMIHNLTTGMYNKNGSITIYYNMTDSSSEWIKWATVNMKNNKTLNAEDLPLGDDRNISRIKLVYSTAPSGFSEIYPVILNGEVVSGLIKDTVIKTKVSLSGKWDGKTIETNKTALTNITKNPDISINARQAIGGQCYVNGILECKFTELKNASNTMLDSLDITCKVPSNTKLYSISTGSYSRKGNVTIYYKTNIDKTWNKYKKVNAKINKTFDIGNKKFRHKGEKITEIKFVFDNPCDGFKMIKSPVVRYQITGVGKIKNTFKINSKFNGDKKIKELTNSIYVY